MIADEISSLPEVSVLSSTQSSYGILDSEYSTVPIAENGLKGVVSQQQQVTTSPVFLCTDIRYKN
jgi:hypothetical protein